MMSLWLISRNLRMIQTWLTALAMTSIVKMSILSMKPTVLIMNVVPTCQISIRLTPRPLRSPWRERHWSPIRKMARPRKVMRLHVISLEIISTNTITTSLSMTALRYAWCEKISRRLIRIISDQSTKKFNVATYLRKTSLPIRIT